MPDISFSGLSSGLDTAGIIQALVNSARIPINRIEGRKAAAQSQISTIADLTSKVKSMQTAANNINTAAEFRAFTATSSDEAKVKVSTTSSAAAGTYQMEIQSLASAERTYSVNTYAASDSTGLVGTGDLTITVGASAPVVVSVDQSTDTLDSVAARINNDVPGVNAAVVYDGTNYRLLVQGEQSGSTNGITFAENGTLNLNMTNEAQAAADAVVVMDGITFNSASNIAKDIIPGVSLDLQDDTEIATAPGTYSTVTVKVDTDLQEIEDRVNAWIAEYNAVIGVVNAENVFTGEADTTGLYGDSTLRTIKTRLQSLITSQVSAVTGSFSALSQIGITTNKSDGTLSLNSTDFQEALAADYEGVTELFTITDNDDATNNDGVIVSILRTVDEFVQTPDGFLPAKTKGLNDRIDDYDDRIARLEDSVASLEQRLRRQFTSLEQEMSRLNNQSNFLNSR